MVTIQAYLGHQVVLDLQVAQEGQVDLVDLVDLVVLVVLAVLAVTEVPTMLVREGLMEDITQVHRIIVIA